MIGYIIGVGVGIMIGMSWSYKPHTITYKDAIQHKCGEYNSKTGKFQFIK